MSASNESQITIKSLCMRNCKKIKLSVTEVSKIYSQLVNNEAEEWKSSSSQTSVQGNCHMLNGYDQMNSVFNTWLSNASNIQPLMIQRLKLWKMLSVKKNPNRAHYTWGFHSIAFMYLYPSGCKVYVSYKHIKILTFQPRIKTFCKGSA